MPRRPRAAAPTPLTDAEALARREALRRALVEADPSAARSAEQLELAEVVTDVPLRFGGRLARGTFVLYDPRTIRYERLASAQKKRPMCMAAIRTPLRPDTNLGLWWEDFHAHTGAPVLPTPESIAEEDRQAAAQHLEHLRAGLPAALTLAVEPKADGVGEWITITDPRTGQSVRVQEWEWPAVQRALIALLPPDPA